MRKINFDRGRVERKKQLEEFREKPVKTPGQPIEDRRKMTGLKKAQQRKD